MAAAGDGFISSSRLAKMVMKIRNPKDIISEAFVHYCHTSATI
jgi:hypothetical protein